MVTSFGCSNPLAFSGLRPGKIVPYLGSSAGIDLRFALRRIGNSGSVVGVDLRDAMIDRAHHNVVATGLTNRECGL